LHEKHVFSGIIWQLADRKALLKFLPAISLNYEEPKKVELLKVLIYDYPYIRNRVKLMSPAQFFKCLSDDTRLRRFAAEAG
jgi:hypothetical protein